MSKVLFHDTFLRNLIKLAWGKFHSCKLRDVMTSQMKYCLSQVVGIYFTSVCERASGSHLGRERSLQEKRSMWLWKLSVKFNKGQSDLFTASRASWQLLSVFFWRQQRYSTCVTAPGVKLLAEARALGATLSSLNEEMKSSWDEMNLADWPNSRCASPFRAQRCSTLWVFFYSLSRLKWLVTVWQTKQRRRVFEISDSLSEQSSCIANFYKMMI